MGILEEKTTKKQKKNYYMSAAAKALAALKIDCPNYSSVSNTRPVLNKHPGGKFTQI